MPDSSLTVLFQRLNHDDNAPHGTVRTRVVLPVCRGSITAAILISLAMVVAMAADCLGIIAAHQPCKSGIHIRYWNHRDTRQKVKPVRSINSSENILLSKNNKDTIIATLA